MALKLYRKPLMIKFVGMIIYKLPKTEIFVRDSFVYLYPSLYFIAFTWIFMDNFFLTYHGLPFLLSKLMTILTEGTILLEASLPMLHKFFNKRLWKLYLHDNGWLNFLSICVHDGGCRVLIWFSTLPLTSIQHLRIVIELEWTITHHLKGKQSYFLLYHTSYI